MHRHELRHSGSACTHSATEIHKTLRSRRNAHAHAWHSPSRSKPSLRAGRWSLPRPPAQCRAAPGAPRPGAGPAAAAGAPAWGPTRCQHMLGVCHRNFYKGRGLSLLQGDLLLRHSLQNFRLLHAEASYGTNCWQLGLPLHLFTCY